MRASAGRLLARYFSTRTLIGALGEKREGLSDELRQDLQGALDKASTGIELVAVVVEAIHPPAGAADSYHEVQAARIRSEVMIAEARRKAIMVMGEDRTLPLQMYGAALLSDERAAVFYDRSLRRFRIWRPGKKMTVATAFRKKMRAEVTGVFDAEGYRMGEEFADFEWAKEEAEIITID